MSDEEIRQKINELAAKGRALIGANLKTPEELNELSGWWPWKKAESDKE